MSAMSERTVDKSGWGPGPWQDEPDKIQWVDEATGLDCLIVRNPLGALCGYVGVPPEHPWHGRDHDRGTPGLNDIADGYFADDCPAERVRVHGGLTYSGRRRENAPESEGICHVCGATRHRDVWWFGFGCARRDDEIPGIKYRWSAGRRTYRTVGYMRRECARLAAQLAVVASDAP